MGWKNEKNIHWSEEGVWGAVHVTPVANVRYILAWGLNAGKRGQVHMVAPSTGQMWSETERRRSRNGFTAYLMPNWPAILQMGYEVRKMSNGAALASPRAPSGTMCKIIHPMALGGVSIPNVTGLVNTLRMGSVELPPMWKKMETGRLRIDSADAIKRMADTGMRDSSLGMLPRNGCPRDTSKWVEMFEFKYKESEGERVLLVSFVGPKKKLILEKRFR